MSQPPSSARLLPTGFRIEHMRPDQGGLTPFAEPEASSVRCPLCGSRSERIHSRYTRTASELPWRGIVVRLVVRARRFFCDEASCERRIFCERLEEVAARARKTARLEEALLAIAFGLSGEAGARLARELGLVVSPEVFLERIRRATNAPDRTAEGQVRVLGVDDFAFRKGTEYGTILVDLERCRVVELLPDRSSEGLADWLRKNASVEVASRDRFPAYADAISAGAPQATQVADRWHLVRNLAEVLDEFLAHNRSVLKAEAEDCEAPPLRRFAASLKKDLSAVRAGLTEPWNNGPVEGFVNKLKLVKRQGYGRANFDLLRARVLAA